MANVDHEPVKKAMSRIRELSADEEAQRLAFVRERAMKDEVSFLNEARRKGHQEGLQEGQHEVRQETARNLIAMNLLNDAQIATASGLSEDEVTGLRKEHLTLLKKIGSRARPCWTNGP